MAATITPATAAAPEGLVTANSYDADGRPVQVRQSNGGTVLRTTSATWTPTGKQASATDANGNVTVNAYDLLDRLVRTTDAEGRVTTFPFDPLSRPVGVFNPAIQSTALLSQTWTANGLKASLTDAVVSHTTTFTYDRYDRLITIGYPAAPPQAATTETFYTGQRIEPEAGRLYYYRARHYSSVFGRFLQVDPTGYATGPNLYAYAVNDPLNLVDPLGLVPSSSSVVQNLAQGTINLVPGAYYSGLARQQYQQGDYLAAGVYGAAMVADFVMGAVTMGVSTRLGSLVRAAAETTTEMLALPAARQVDYAWGALNTYRPGVQMTAIEHINYRHAFESGASNVSRFAEGTSAREIKSLVDQTSRYGTVTAKGADRFMLEHFLGRTIGTDQSGAAASGVRVYIRGGQVQTAFPIVP